MDRARTGPRVESKFNRPEVSRAVPSPQEEKQTGQVSSVLAVWIAGAQAERALQALRRAAEEVNN
jgi:hypothetical protein